MRMRKARATALYMNTVSLEDWYKGQPTEAWRRVEIVEQYEWDGRQRVSVRILEGPEAGRVVSGMSPGQIEERNVS